MPPFGLAPQAIATPGGFAQGFSNLGAAFINAPMEQRRLNQQQEASQAADAFKKQELAQAFQIAQGHDASQERIWAGRGDVSRQNTQDRTGTQREIADANNETKENVAGTNANAKDRQTDSRERTAHYVQGSKEHMAYQKLAEQSGSDPHEAIDKAADDMLKGMPKTAPSELPGMPNPIGMTQYMQQAQAVNAWRQQEHQKIYQKVREATENAGDPQQDKPVTPQGPGMPNQMPQQPSETSRAMGQPGAHAAPDPGPAAQAFGAQGRPGASAGVGASSPNVLNAPATTAAPNSPNAKPGKMLPRRALMVRVQRGEYPNEAAAEADAKAHGFTISDN